MLLLCRNISDSLASKVFEVCNATQFKIRNREFENYFEKKVSFKLTQNKQNF